MFKQSEKENHYCKLPGIYYYSILLRMPVSLTFDFHLKNQKKLKARDAARSSKITSHYNLEVEKANMEHSDSHSIANIELDEEGTGVDCNDVCKMEIETDNSIITIQARVIRIPNSHQKEVFLYFKHALEACKCHQKWQSPLKTFNSSVSMAPDEDVEEKNDIENKISKNNESSIKKVNKLKRFSTSR